MERTPLSRRAPRLRVSQNVVRERERTPHGVLYQCTRPNHVHGVPYGFMNPSIYMQPCNMCAVPRGINYPHALSVTPSARSTALPRHVTQVYKVHVVAAPERCSRPSAARWPGGWPGGWRRRQLAAAELGPLEGGAAPPRQAKHRAATVGLAPVRRQGAVLPTYRARMALPLASPGVLRDMCGSGGVCGHRGGKKEFNPPPTKMPPGGS